MLAACNEVERNIINTYVESKWYDRESYDKLIANMKDAAHKSNDSLAKYAISYYLDFDSLCQEAFADSPQNIRYKQ